MLMLVGALLVGYLVPLAVYFFLESAHPNDEEYKKDCRKLLFQGWLLGFPVFGFSLLCNIFFGLTQLGDKSEILKLFFSNFVLKAFSEELMKYLLAARTFKKNRGKAGFLDLMSFCAISAIGFEMMESIIYIFESNIPQILVRAITNMHAAFGLIAGYIIAKGIKKGRKHPAVLGVLVATIVHGVYDLCLADTLVDTDWGFLALAIAAGCLILNICNYFFMKKARNDSYYTDPL